jgi:hypothetical protein
VYVYVKMERERRGDEEEWRRGGVEKGGEGDGVEERSVRVRGEKRRE